MPDAALPPEAQARRRIDALLEASGWRVQDRGAIHLSAGSGVAVRELPTASGEADYGLFLGQELVGVVEAKKVGATLGGVEAQTLAYASQTLPGLQVPVQPLPFRYESTGVETFFTNGLDPDPTARRVFSFHRPETLGEWLRAEVMRRAGQAGAPVAPTASSTRCWRSWARFLVSWPEHPTVRYPVQMLLACHGRHLLYGRPGQPGANHEACLRRPRAVDHYAQW